MGLFKKDKKELEPQYYVSPINNQVLNYHVYHMKPMEKLLFTLGLILVGGVVGLIFYGGLFKVDGEATFATFISNIVVFVVVGLIASKIFMPVLCDMLKKRRLNKLKMQFRDFLSALSNSLSGGMNVVDSLVNSYADMEMQFSANSYIAKEISEIINGINNNIPIEIMMADFGKRSGVDDISNFAIVFETAYRTGGNLKEIVRRTTDIISEKTMINAEIETKMTSNKMQMNAMLIIPVILMIMLKTMSAEFASSFASVIGVICVSVAVCLFFVAYKVGQKIMDIKG